MSVEQHEDKGPQGPQQTPHQNSPAKGQFSGQIQIPVQRASDESIQPQPKKKHTVRTVILIVLIVAGSFVARHSIIPALWGDTSQPAPPLPSISLEPSAVVPPSTELVVPAPASSYPPPNATCIGGVKRTPQIDNICSGWAELESFVPSEFNRESIEDTDAMILNRFNKGVGATNRRTFSVEKVSMAARAIVVNPTAGDGAYDALFTGAATRPSGEDASGAGFTGYVGSGEPDTSHRTERIISNVLLNKPNGTLSYVSIHIVWVDGLKNEPPSARGTGWWLIDTITPQHQ